MTGRDAMQTLLDRIRRTYQDRQVIRKVQPPDIKALLALPSGAAELLISYKGLYYRVGTVEVVEMQPPINNERRAKIGVLI